MKIDAVITWVDGNDERHRQKLRHFCPQDVLNAEDKAGDERFANIGEIFWCIASLNRFAPWLNKIYVVTDEQDPGLDGFLAANFPSGYIPVEIVDHKTIFRGYEQYLPTFNSITIETMTWRIPGLSDYYIEFNDDLMLAQPVTPEDFFTPDGKVICYGEFSSIPFTRFTRLFKPRGTVTTKSSHANGAVEAGNRFRYLRLAHCQKALRRDFWENYYRDHPEKLIANIEYRFRSDKQFTSQALQYVTLYNEGKCVVKSVGDALFFMQPKPGTDYFDRKMARLRAIKPKYLCLNSIEKLNGSQRQELIAWIEQLLDIKL